MRTMENIVFFFFFLQASPESEGEKERKGREKEKDKEHDKSRGSYVENPNRNPPKERVQKKRVSNHV